MTDLRKAAERALDSILDIPMGRRSFAQMEAVTALRQALAEPANSTTNLVEPKASSQTEQESVAWIGKGACQQLQEGASVTTTLTSHQAFLDDVPLYIASPKREWVGLSDEEKYDVLEGATGDGGRVYYDTLFQSYEAKLKQKNEPA